MSENENRYQRRKFPAIAGGITCLALGLVLILFGAKYCTTPAAYTGEYIEAQ